MIRRYKHNIRTRHRYPQLFFTPEASALRYEAERVFGTTFTAFVSRLIRESLRRLPRVHTHFSVSEKVYLMHQQQALRCYHRPPDTYRNNLMAILRQLEWVTPAESRMRMAIQRCNEETSWLPRTYNISEEHEE